jgi:hypothetical protein
MRVAILAIVMAIGATTTIDTTPAQARDFPFCIKGPDYPSGLGQCAFDTYEQCQATASGRYAYCDANPYYQGNVAPAESRQRRQSPRYGY